MQEFRKDALAEEPWVVRNAAQAAAKNVGKALDALAQGYIYPALGWAFEAGHEWRYARERAQTPEGQKALSRFYSAVWSLLTPSRVGGIFQIHPQVERLFNSLFEGAEEKECEEVAPNGN